MADEEQVQAGLLSKIKNAPVKSLRLSKVHPNDWNPNEMAAGDYAKLKRGLQRIMKNNPDSLPPIIVRRHPHEPGQYQIIDGFHRWKAFGELKRKRINAWVIKADDKDARILTTNLNYLRGEPNRGLYAKGLVELIAMGMKTDELAQLLPESEEDIDALLDETDVNIEAYQQLQQEDDERLKEMEKHDSEEVWIDMKFKVPVDAAKIIEQEIARISNAIKGKNKRGRALEIAMVASSQSDLPDDLS